MAIQMNFYCFVNACVPHTAVNGNKLFCFTSVMHTLVMCLRMDQTQPVRDSVSTAWLWTLNPGQSNVSPWPVQTKSPKSFFSAMFFFGFCFCPCVVPFCTFVLCLYVWVLELCESTLRGVYLLFSDCLFQGNSLTFKMMCKWCLFQVNKCWVLSVPVSWTGLFVVVTERVFSFVVFVFKQKNKIKMNCLIIVLLSLQVSKLINYCVNKVCPYKNKVFFSPLKHG